MERTSPRFFHKLVNVVHKEGAVLGQETCFSIAGTQVQCANVFLKLSQSIVAGEWERIVKAMQNEPLPDGRIRYYFTGYRLI